MQAGHSKRIGFVQRVLILGPSQYDAPNCYMSFKPTQSDKQTIQWSPSQRSGESRPPLLAPRTALIKEQGFSDQEAVQIEAPHKFSTRAVYEAK